MPELFTGRGEIVLQQNQEDRTHRGPVTEGADSSLAPLSLPRFSMSVWVLQPLPRLRDGDLVSEGKAVTPSAKTCPPL